MRFLQFWSVQGERLSSRPEVGSGVPRWGGSHGRGRRWRYGHGLGSGRGRSGRGPGTPGVAVRSILLGPIIGGVDISCQQGLVLTDLEPGLLERDVGELSQGHTLLPAQVAVPVLEKLPAVLADSQVQAGALHVRVLGFSAGAVDVVRRQGLYGALGERESAHGRGSFRRS